MRDDVVKLAPCRVNGHHVGLAQLYVLEAQIANHLQTVFKRQRGQIGPHELAVGKVERHWHDVGSIAATQFQNATVTDRSRLQAHQRSDHRQPVRVGLRVGITRITDGVVWCGRHVFLMGQSTIGPD